MAPEAPRPRQDRAPGRHEARNDRPHAPRDHRRRDDDLGPAVQGFGDDIPAFMTLPVRASRLKAEMPEDRDV
jgi:hypothetical protein